MPNVSMRCPTVLNERTNERCGVVGAPWAPTPHLQSALFVALNKVVTKPDALQLLMSDMYDKPQQPLHVGSQVYPV